MLNEQEKLELIELTNLLEQRKKFFSIRNTTLQPHQKLLEDAIREKIEIKDWRNTIYKPKYRKILFQWWNGSWKTFTWLYLTVKLALWELCSNYWLEYIWSRKNIWIVTKSWANITSTIEPYLLWEYSSSRIPPDAIEKINSDNWILKSIVLKNWTKISIRTYDQWAERLQWWNPDFILIDEEPVKSDVWQEILARWRSMSCQIVITMTPLSWLTPVYEYFYEQSNEEVRATCKIILVSSLDNKFADHSWLLWLSEQDKQMRIYWMFTPSTWLVFSSFSRYNNVVEHFEPKELWEVKYYWAIDFWHTHPTAFLAIAVDSDNNIYIFDMIYKSWLLMKEISELINQLRRKYWINFEYIVADSAAKQQREELKALWIKTVAADKWSKWENNESNRKAWIFKVNWLLSDRKLFISDNCKPLISEFENHHYKENWKDWEVEKTQDDALDALRYFIFWYKPKKLEDIYKKDFNKTNWIIHNKYHYYESNYNNPY